MKIDNKQNKKNWDAKIEWVDNNKYLKLSESDKKKLIRFRSLHSYINKMNKSIDIRNLSINQLVNEIKEREKKIKQYEIEGKGLYQFLEKLKTSLEITTYYTEGKTTKKSKRFSDISTTKEIVYSQCLLRFSTKNVKKLHSINMGPKRKDILNEIKKVDSKWYSENGKNLTIESHTDIKKVRKEITKYFHPIIQKLFKRNYQRILDGKYSLTKDKLYAELGKVNK
jgi:hypothetical protein